MTILLDYALGYFHALKRTDPELLLSVAVDISPVARSCIIKKVISPYSENYMSNITNSGYVTYDLMLLPSQINDMMLLLQLNLRIIEKIEYAIHNPQ